MSEMNRRAKGTKEEEIACKYLMSKNLKFIQKNFRCHQGEIDLIMKDQDAYVFVEVKYRSSAAFGFPEEAVGPSKQKTIRQVAKYYLTTKVGREDIPCRFDVVAIQNDRIHWILDAF